MLENAIIQNNNSIFLFYRTFFCFSYWLKFYLFLNLPKSLHQLIEKVIIKTLFFLGCLFQRKHINLFIASNTELLELTIVWHIILTPVLKDKLQSPYKFFIPNTPQTCKIRFLQILNQVLKYLWVTFSEVLKIGRLIDEGHAALLKSLRRKIVLEIFWEQTD